MRESEIERKICAEAKRLGLLPWKLTVPGAAGVPDRMFLDGAGGVAFLELKAPGRMPSPLQLKRIRDLCNRGFLADWVDNVEDGVDFLRSWCES